MVRPRSYLKELGDRFWSKVNKTETCWLWTAHTDKDGYGIYRAERKNWRVHRLTYEDVNGPIPIGLVIDHLCRTRNCVRPSHLEATTAPDNVRRGFVLQTHCSKEHEYTASNTGKQSNGRRYCRQCERDRNKARRAYLTAYMRTYRASAVE